MIKNKTQNDFTKESLYLKLTTQNISAVVIKSAKHQWILKGNAISGRFCNQSIHILWNDGF